MYDNSGKAADELDLNKLLEDRLVANYKESLEDNKGAHFSNKEELKEFLADGQASLEWFKKNRAKYFSKKNTQLLGIEIPILQPVLEDIPNVLINGSIDFIEFMMLMFKIQRGTIDLEENALAQSMIEAKAQIKIFEDKTK
jgi:hypothetical protein